MLQPIEGLPSSVVAFEASGEVEASDYQDVLDPAVDAALEAHDKVRFLYVLGDEFEGYTAHAMWEDTKVGVGHWARWEKIALVTDDHTYHNAVKAFGWLFPGDLKLFSLAELADAKDWIAA